MISSTAQTVLAVEAVLALPFLVIGLSHLIRPRLWHELFKELASMGHMGIIYRTFLFELWPAAAIVAFHQDWSWPDILVTIYGHALIIKIAVSLIFPEIGLRSLELAATRGPRVFLPAGIVLCVLGIFCCTRVFGVLS